MSSNLNIYNKPGKSLLKKYPYTLKKAIEDSLGHKGDLNKAHLSFLEGVKYALDGNEREQVQNLIDLIYEHEEVQFEITY